MPRLSSRRSWTPESDDDDDVSRPETPASSAPNDRKRIRRSAEADDDCESGDGSEAALSPPGPTQRQEAERKPTLINGQLSATGHQPGAIVRVKLVNFVTYSSAEFFPGPSLNMVIGPNGTGKSTLVCAICLGLGWGTQYLGRAKDAAEFVKHGCSEATIELELQRSTTGPNATRRNPVLTRTIKKDGNKSKFYLNGNESTGKTVQNFARKFNIQIDNLCQFLPQDKVVEFAQMSPIEILESTQRAAAPPEALKMHANLKELRKAQKELLGANRGDREQLENLERRQEMSRAEVERMRDRQIAKQRMEWLEKIRPVLEYSTLKREGGEAKQRQKKLLAEVRQLETDSAPTQRKVAAKEAYKKQAEAFRRQKQTSLAACERRCDDIDKENKKMEDKCEDLDQNFKAEKGSQPTRREQAREARQKIASLQDRYSHKPAEVDSRAINQEIQELKTEVRELEEKREDASNRLNDLKQQLHTRQVAGHRLTAQLEGLETQSGQQEERLNTLSRDTLKAWKWIQENRDQFEGQVYGPPLVECSLKEVGSANAVEAFLQRGEFLIITVQNHRDFALLQKKFNTEMGLHDIRLRTCTDTSLDAFQRPLTEDEMRENGFHGFAIDHLNGPPTVLAMLCHEKRLHTCAIAARDISQEEHDFVARKSLSAYYSKGQVYQFVHRKEYGAAGSMARTRVTQPAANWTKQGVDMGRKANLEREIGGIRDELATIRDEVANCNKEVEGAGKKIGELNRTIRDIAKDKEEKQRAIAEWRAIPTKIKQEEEKVQQHEEFLKGVRDRLLEIMAKKDQVLLDKAEVVIQYASTASQARQALSSVIEAEVMLIEATSDHEVLLERSEHIRHAIETRKREEQEAQAEAKNKIDRAKALVKACQELRAESQVLAEQGDDSAEKLLEAVGAEGWTVQRLEGEIDSQKAQIELTEGGNANVIKEFEERAKQIERLQLRLTDFNQQQIDLQGAIAEVRAKWQTDLEALVAEISHAFSDSFARIGCAGQVVIHKASSADPIDCTEENGGQDNGLDFANWAIHISVKFREHEPLSLLDSHRQSGGERAVSTIFYLMALQSLSRAPFRVVDEINQGMDPRNERMVHGRMVDVATDSGGSQYFLITPKLLSGLKYKRGMTVLCIVSGENVPGERGTDAEGNEFENPKIDFRAFVRKARELKLRNADGGRRVDSGVGLEHSLGSMTEVET